MGVPSYHQISAFMNQWLGDEFQRIYFNWFRGKEHCQELMDSGDTDPNLTFGAWLIAAASTTGIPLLPLLRNSLVGHLPLTAKDQHDTQDTMLWASSLAFTGFTGGALRLHQL